MELQRMTKMVKSPLLVAAVLSLLSIAVVADAKHRAAHRDHQLAAAAAAAAADKDKWPSKKECGKFEALEMTADQKEHRLAGGFRTHAKHFPSFAHILMIGINGAANWTCAGALVSERFVLTHKNCLSKGDSLGAIVTLGLGGGASGATKSAERRIAANQRCFCEPNERAGKKLKIDFQLELLRLVKKVSFKPSIQPACVREAEAPEDTGVYDSLEAYFVASSAVANEENGQTEDESADDGALRVLPVKSDECPAQYENEGWIERICMKPNTKYGGSSCKGDLGAPLLADMDGRHELLGILKQQKGTCNVDDLETGGYSIVRQFAAYIKGAAKHCKPIDAVHWSTYSHNNSHHVD